MGFFKLEGVTLDSAFRTLCSKIYFKAEAQQIDRILEAFAKRYWQCNPHCIFGSSDTVHAVVYSLLLLNTDLHVAQSHTKMTRPEFIQNTMSTLRDHHQQTTPQWESAIEHELKEMYMSVKHYQIVQTPGNKRSSILLSGGRRLKRSVSSMIRGPRPVPEEKSVRDPDLPYKEGLVMRKHLLVSAGQKARFREWRLCWLEIGIEGELRMYDPPPSIGDKSLFGQSNNTSVKQKKRRGTVFSF